MVDASGVRGRAVILAELALTAAFALQASRAESHMADGSRSPKPPRRRGRVACFQHWSVMLSTCRMLHRALLMYSAQWEARSAVIVLGLLC